MIGDEPLQGVGVGMERGAVVGAQHRALLLPQLLQHPALRQREGERLQKGGEIEGWMTKKGWRGKKMEVEGWAEVERSYVRSRFQHANVKNNNTSQWHRHRVNACTIAHAGNHKPGLLAGLHGERHLQSCSLEDSQKEKAFNNQDKYTNMHIHTRT